MIVSKKEKRKIIKPLLPQFPEGQTEPAFRNKSVKGEELIAGGEKKDRSGKLIVSQQWYTIRETIQVPVNHERRLSQIIDSSQDFDTMTTALAEYLRKYGIRKQPAED